MSTSASLVPAATFEPAGDPPARFPLSHAQRAMWWLHRWAPESAAYNQSTAFVVEGPVDLEALAAALRALVARHEVLRTAYLTRPDGVPLQRVLSADEVTLSVTPVYAERAELAALLRREAAATFDLQQPPAIRVAVLTAPGALTAVVVSAHHVSIDGWSAVRVLGPELAALYEGRELPPLPIQYKDYALWEEGRERAGAFDRHLAFWRARLAGAPPAVALPTDHPRPPAQTFAGDRVLGAVAAGPFERFARLCERGEVPLSAGMIALLDVCLHHWTGQRDLVVGTVTAHREQPETEGLIGNFIQFLPLRLVVDPSASAAELLQRSADVFVEARAHEDCPFPLIVEKARTQVREAGGNPIYNVAFLLHRFPRAVTGPQHGFEDVRDGGLRDLFDELGVRLGRPFNLGAARGGMGWIDNPGALLDLRLLAFPYPGGGCGLECEYNSALFAPATARLVLDAYARLVEEVADHPERSIGELTAAAALRAHRAAAPAPTPASPEEADAPPCPLEGEVAAIFAEVLGRPSVSRDENFFAAGGDSMRALQALTLIEDRLDAPLAVSALSEAPTPAALARRLAGGAKASRVVSLNATGARPPLLCGHPVGGNVTAYGPLARALGPDQPLLAFEAAGLDGRTAPLRSIEEMAARGLADLRAARPRGPYVLAGWSYGGIIAYEMACRLAAEEPAPLLALIDSWSPFDLGGGVEEYLDDPQALAWLALSAYGPAVGDPHLIATRLRACRGRGAMVDALDRIAAAAGVPHRIPREHLGHVVEVFLANAGALLRYRPGRYRGPAVFFRPRESSPELASGIVSLGLAAEKREIFLSHVVTPARGWAELMPQMVIEDAPGDHYSMMAEPHVATLARALARHLDGIATTEVARV